MKRAYIYIALVLLPVLLGACQSTGTSEQSQGGPSGNTDTPPGYQTVTANEARELMADGCIILDVRTEEEFRQGYIEGAILIPDTEIAGRAEAELTDKNAVIVVYCRSGRRSALAAGILANMGYTNVYDLGGIIDWPYDTVGG